MTPLMSNLEAVTIKMENPAITYVDLFNPILSPLRHSFPDISNSEEEDLAGKLKLFSINHPLPLRDTLNSTRESEKVNMIQREAPKNHKLLISLTG